MFVCVCVLTGDIANGMTIKIVRCLLNTTQRREIAFL